MDGFFGGGVIEGGKTLLEKICGLCGGSGDCPGGCNHGQRKGSVEVCIECSPSSGGRKVPAGACPACGGTGEDSRFTYP
ncbi:MAG: hypothetical protein V4437_00015 [Patescibacteria group bacterium]